MKVLLVCHNYLPAHTAGTEIYTAQLARRLVELEVGVRVFTSDKLISRPDLTLVEREHEGVPVSELVNNLHYAEFGETWDHPRIAALFGELLDRERPDVCHFQHLMYLSIGCVEEASKRGIPIVFTLHDYWLQCPRHGQRIHADQSICHTIEFDRCGACLASFKFRQTTLERVGGRMLARLREGAGIDLAAAAKGARELLRGDDAASGPPTPDPQLAAELATSAERRDTAMRERLVPLVDRFLSPSRFLRDRLIEWGVPAERITYVRTGLDPARFPPEAPERRRREPGAPLRVGFVGTLAPHKGPDLLLEAWSHLTDDARAGATLDLYGPSRHNDAFRDELARTAARVGANLAGELARDEVARALCDLDLLVVPSIWFENAPLVIHEALATRTPLLVARIGGMAELVEEGRSGYLFEVGDAEDLARHLRELIAEPERLATLYPEPIVFKSVDEDARGVLALYRELCDA